MNADFQNNLCAVLDKPEADFVSQDNNLSIRKKLSKQEQFDEDIANSPFYDRAVVAFKGHIGKNRFYHSALPGYYRDYQAAVLQQMQAKRPRQMQEVQRLFIASFVAGADADIAAVYGPSHRDVPIAAQIKDNIGQIVSGRYQDRDSINARLAIQHELGWIGQLAHREGALNAQIIQRQQSDQSGLKL